MRQLTLDPYYAILQIKSAAVSLLSFKWSSVGLVNILFARQITLRSN